MPKWLPLAIAIGLLLLWLTVGSDLQRADPTAEIPYSQLKALVADNVVESATFRGDEIRAVLSGRTVAGSAGEQVSHVIALVPEIGDDTLVPLLGG